MRSVNTADMSLLELLGGYDVRSMNMADLPPLLARCFSALDNRHEQNHADQLIADITLQFLHRPTKFGAPVDVKMECACACSPAPKCFWVKGKINPWVNGIIASKRQGPNPDRVMIHINSMTMGRLTNLYEDDEEYDLTKWTTKHACVWKNLPSADLDYPKLHSEEEYWP